MRLFSALVPPPPVLRALATELTRYRLPGSPEPRWAPRESWHITLAFYGDDSVRARAEWLAPQLAGCVPLRLELSGAGTFPGVLWAGVGGDLGGLHQLGRAAGAGDPGSVGSADPGGSAAAGSGGAGGSGRVGSAGPGGSGPAGSGGPGRPYHPHLTLARWRAPREPDAVRRVLHGMTGYRGPSWLAADVVLMRSETAPGGQRRYTVQERFELTHG